MPADPDRPKRRYTFTNQTREQRTEQMRRAGFASHQPEVLAERLAEMWPNLSDDRRQQVITNLAPLAEQQGQVDR